MGGHGHEGALRPLVRIHLIYADDIIAFETACNQNTRAIISG